MKLVQTKDAVGRILCHDMTQVIPGVYKGTRFRKGHVVQEADIPVLLDMGKERIYVWEKTPGMVHEEEGAEALRGLCQGANVRAEAVFEGKIELFAACDGLLKIRTEKLAALNGIDGLMAATLRGNQGVREGGKIAAVKIIPLLIEEEKLDRAARICGGEKLVDVLPYHPKKAGLIVTGTEIARGRIPNAAPGAVRKKLAPFAAETTVSVALEDDPEEIAAHILSMIREGLDLILCTGGMSVDPDDKTPLGIKNTGARIVSYGMPLLPGAMTLLAYYEAGEKTVPILGLPACVLHDSISAVDILLPRIAADDPISREDLARLGEGGLS
ncbi:MAG: molybdopterin-binding protein [Treponema sp.]|jgi:molybdopterin biosynthesis enzyme|nr:molybdopterin-binding protein [Treponema sp.]